MAITQRNQKLSKKLNQQKMKPEKVTTKIPLRKTRSVRNNKKELDSWLQSQLEHTSTCIFSEDESEIEFNLRKNIDHKIPSHAGSVYNVAKELINDDNVSICRDTGIMKKREGSTKSTHSGKSSKKTTGRKRREETDQHSRREVSPHRHRTNNHAGRYKREEPWARDMNRALHDYRSGQSSSTYEKSDTNEYDSSSSSITEKPVKLKTSGIDAKPSSKVKIELTYPHFSLCQTSAFMGTNIAFHHLTYEQFLAGELYTVMNTSSLVERKGRITLLSKITNWKLMSGVTWLQIRNTYAHILQQIENEQISWKTDFDKFERNIYERIALKQDRVNTMKKGVSINSDWFCKAYQKLEGCSHEPPHLARVGSQNCMVQHFCAACWTKDRTIKKPHLGVFQRVPLKGDVSKDGQSREMNDDVLMLNKDLAICQDSLVTYQSPESFEFQWDIPGLGVDPQFFQIWSQQMGQNNYIQDLLLAHKVIQSGIPNRFGCRIPVKSTWNIPLMESLLSQYHDKDVLEWLKFGFTVSRENLADPWPSNTNHAGATQFPNSINTYLLNEIRLGATMGPFVVPPFINRIGISPLSSRPKRDSHERRIILDLSFPFSNAVNDGIAKDSYYGQKIRLTYPTIDTLCQRIAQLGRGCLIWK